MVYDGQDDDDDDDHDGEANDIDFLFFSGDLMAEVGWMEVVKGSNHQC